MSGSSSTIRILGTTVSLCSFCQLRDAVERRPVDASRVALAPRASQAARRGQRKTQRDDDGAGVGRSTGQLVIRPMRAWLSTRRDPCASASRAASVSHSEVGDRGRCELPSNRRSAGRRAARAQPPRAAELQGAGGAAGRAGRPPVFAARPSRCGPSGGASRSATVKVLPTPRLALHRGLAVVHVGDLAHGAEAQAAAQDLHGVLVLDARELVEQLGGLFGGEPDAGVGRRRCATASPLRAMPTLTRPPSRLYLTAFEMRLLKTISTSPGSASSSTSGRCLELHGDAAALRRRRRRAPSTARELAEIQALDDALALAGLDAREVEQVAR